MHKPPAQLAALSVAVAGLVLAGCAQITCDRFTLHGTLIGNTLAASVTTDVPDHTEVEVRVSRLVHVEGEEIPYTIHYFIEKGRIDAWRSPRTIELDHDKWWRDLRAKQQAGGPTGERLRVGRIEPTIELEMLVPVDQDDKRFGDANWNLRGKAVDIEGTWRVIRRKLAFDCPLPADVHTDATNDHDGAIGFDLPTAAGRMPAPRRRQGIPLAAQFPPTHREGLDLLCQCCYHRISSILR